MDGHVEPRSIYREAWDTYRKYPASLLVPGSALTAEVLVALGLLLLIVPGVYLAARYAVVAPASAFEHGWPRRSLARSRDLVRSHYKLAFLTVVAMFALEQIASTFADDLLGSL